ncbi:hypothetical protein KJZ61_02025 [Candidatus Dependentiae bacterium]|nr:hypothetical protein [Candidatus Dependentiae bacterium]
MKVSNYFGIVVLMSLCAHISLAKNALKKEPELFLIDKIEAVIFDNDGASVITKSDTEKLTLEGKPQTLGDIIFTKRVFADATKYRITPSEDAIDRYLDTVMHDNNMGLPDVERMFNAAGYTYEEGREQLATMFAVNSMIDFKVKSYLVVPEAQIIAYYKEHPIEEEAAYKIQRLVVTDKKIVSTQDNKKRLKLALEAGKEIPGVKVSPAFWIKHDELAADKMFITTMIAGDISDPVSIPEGFELFRLLERRERRIVPLEERYQEIAQELKRPLFEKRFEEYRKSLFDEASIVYY